VFYPKSKLKNHIYSDIKSLVTLAFIFFTIAFRYTNAEYFVFQFATQKCKY
jgi:hypothetical protein